MRVLADADKTPDECGRNYRVYSVSWWTYIEDKIIALFIESNDAFNINNRISLEYLIIIMTHLKNILIAYICISAGIDVYLLRKMRAYGGRESVPVNMIKSGFRSEIEVMKMELCENE
jgi:hypothetical protein